MRDGHRLTLLVSGDSVVGYRPILRGHDVYILTDDDPLPIYAFKMGPELMRLLRKHKEVWLDEKEV